MFFVHGSGLVLSAVMGVDLLLSAAMGVGLLLFSAMRVYCSTGGSACVLLSLSLRLVDLFWYHNACLIH